MGSFPPLFRYLFAALFVVLLAAVWTTSRFKKYRRVLDALFILVLLWFLPLIPFYKEFLAAAKEPFFLVFGRSDLVNEVANNSTGGLFWILLPIILVLIERDSLKDIFISKGKLWGWAVGFSTMLILMAVGVVIALHSGLEPNVFLTFVPLGIAFALINAVKEEVLYRGLIFSRTLKFGFLFALFCQLSWFLLIHALYSGGGKSIGMIMGVSFFAVVASWLTKKTESVACAVLAHAGIDFIIFCTMISH